MVFLDAFKAAFPLFHGGNAANTFRLAVLETLARIIRKALVP